MLGISSMDMDLPDVDGVKTTAILKKNPKTSHIPVVALTA
jgi:CheY-like chemotaxis protein